MTLTSHGWYIPGTTIEDEPKQKQWHADCGGPRQCNQCRGEEVRAFNLPGKQ